MAVIAVRREAFIDVETGGAATISGVVKVLTTAVSRPVYLMENDTFRVRRVTQSAADGTYSFTKLATGMSWLVLAVDTDGAYNAVVADRVQT
ncbi:MAG: hypothetical protein K2W33_05665 [Burkholderiales bacterium]|nr:hypothetical protein [Burkholderiales bacterium]